MVDLQSGSSFPSLTLVGTRTTAVVWGEGRFTQRECMVAGQAQTDFAFPLHVPSRLELLATLKPPSWALSGKHKKIVPTGFISAS